MSRLFQDSIQLVGSCYHHRNKPFWKTGKYAALCTSPSIKALISEDYARTGKCNYYMTDDEMHHMNLAMVFQVFIAAGT